MRGLLHVTDRVVLPGRTSYSVFSFSNNTVSATPGITLCHYPIHERNPGPAIPGRQYFAENEGNLEQPFVNFRYDLSPF